MKDHEWYMERIVEPCIGMYETILWERKLSEEELSAQVCEEKEWLLGGGCAISRIVIIVTTRCSLKCVDCSQLIPCYEEPYDCDMEEIINSMSRLLRIIDKCYDVNIIGGEAFLVKGIGRLVDWLKSQEKVIQVSLTTNGTITLDEKTIDSLRDKKVVVRISDYGLLRQQVKFLSDLEGQGVHVEFESGMKWVNAGNGAKRNRSKEELKRLYKRCNSGKNCKTLFKGKIYHCSRCASLYDLKKAFFESTRDAFIIKTDESEQDARRRIKDFFLFDYSNACDNCDIALENKRYIPAGIQKNEKVKTSNFTIVSRRDFEIRDKMLLDCREEICKLQKTVDDYEKMNNELRVWSEDLQRELNRLRAAQ